MSTHNICFRREIRKILCGYPLLSAAMYEHGPFSPGLEAVCQFHVLVFASLSFS